VDRKNRYLRTSKVLRRSIDEVVQNGAKKNRLNGGFLNHYQREEQFMPPPLTAIVLTLDGLLVQA